ncbi:MAG: holdfast anchor protein HfaD [Asticcacaulis sp.]|uniref:holdfast anchor protein HfaD n=1 Tax=Asticcacaulis sp. TaxID=1872648 RepID=UPI0039E4A504
MSLPTSLATILLLLTATAATSQEIPDGDINNDQTQNGAISATQALNVEQNDGLTKAITSATGNALQVSTVDYDATLYSYQFNKGRTTAETHITGTNTGDEDTSLGTPVYVTTDAIANYATGVTEGAHLTASTQQQSTSDKVIATTDIQSPNNAIYISGEGDSTAEVNHTGYQVTNGRLDSTSVQQSSTEAHANTSVTLHYSPSPNAYNATATNNYYGSYSDDRGSQEHDVTQTQSAMTQARAEVYAGNVWDTSANATAVGNDTNLQNAGGSLVVTSNQTQAGEVQSQAVLQADEYGAIYANASGTGNSMVAGNNDVYLRIDNTQLSSGGVDVTASIVGNEGWDAYATADATGNSAVGYACAACQADMGVDNTQTNNSDVNATATASVSKGRSVVSTARATGNSATYYVSN